LVEPHFRQASFDLEEKLKAPLDKPSKAVPNGANRWEIKKPWTVVIYTNIRLYDYGVKGLIHILQLLLDMPKSSKAKAGHHYYLKSAFSKSVLVYIKPETHRKLKIRAIKEGVPLQELLRQAIEKMAKD
jgi:hypothetical protein